MATHDPSYKLLFSHRKMVSDLLCGFVREEWAERLDLNTLERVREVGISQNLRQRVDDVIWRLRIIEDGRARWLYVYILLEFQSTVDRIMAARLLTYIGLLYEDLHRSKEIGPDDPLPPVLPIVLYNGAEPWTAKTDLADLIDPSLPPQLRHWQPQLRYLLLEERRYPEPTSRVCPMLLSPCSAWRMPRRRRTSSGSSPAWSSGSPGRTTRACAVPSSSGSSAYCFRRACPASRYPISAS